MQMTPNICARECKSHLVVLLFHNLQVALHGGWLNKTPSLDSAFDQRLDLGKSFAGQFDEIVRSSLSLATPSLSSLKQPRDLVTWPYPFSFLFFMVVNMSYSYLFDDSLFCTPLHSMMASNHLLLWRRFLLPTCTVSCRMVLDGPRNLDTWTHNFCFLFFMLLNTSLFILSPPLSHTQQEL